MSAEIRYGKHNVSFYRTHPRRGLLGGRVSIDVFGDNFMPAYTEGDNRGVVATDTMKNFVYAMALAFPGDRYELFAEFLGRPYPGSLATRDERGYHRPFEQFGSLGLTIRRG